MLIRSTVERQADCVTWCIDMTRSHAWHGWFVYDLFTHVTWLIHRWLIDTLELEMLIMSTVLKGAGCPLLEYAARSISTCIVLCNKIYCYHMSRYVTEHVDRSDQSASLWRCQIYQYLRCVISHILLLWSDHILLLWYVRWNVRDMTDSCVTQLIHMWHKSSQQWYNGVWHDSFMCNSTDLCMTQLIHMWHDRVYRRRD